MSRLALALLLLLAAAPAFAAGDSTQVAARIGFGRRDAAFLLGAGALTALVATRDAEWSARAHAEGSRFALDLAADAKRLGDVPTVGAALLASDGLARLAHREPVAAAAERIAFAEVAAGVVSLAIKEVAGRERPDETSSPHRFRPFSGHDAFPSGHATVAFALAASLDAEVRAPWLRAIVYPAAALTAWSRVRDHRHWPSDVVAAAALGGGCAYRADQFAQRRFPHGLAVVLLPRRGGATLGATRRF